MDVSRRLLLLFPAIAPLLGAAAPRGWSDDAFFGKPVIDLDEQRSAPRPHRFVHGHFEGTDFLVPSRRRANTGRATNRANRHCRKSHLRFAD
ncbi:MAG: hypothetical protein WC068_14710 [Caulobacter sp.]